MRIPLLAGVAGVLLAGCCDKAVVEACLADRARDSAAALAQAAVVNAPGEALELSGSHVDGVELDATVVDAACREGRGTAATVEVTWKVRKPGVQAVRILVGSGEQADKTWVEAGASGTQRTGPWIGDGSLLRMEALATRESLALVRVKSRPCQ